jgi:hypothetical protein
VTGRAAKRVLLEEDAEQDGTGSSREDSSGTGGFGGQQNRGFGRTQCSPRAGPIVPYFVWSCCSGCLETGGRALAPIRYRTSSTSLFVSTETTPPSTNLIWHSCSDRIAISAACARLMKRYGPVRLENAQKHAAPECALYGSKMIANSEESFRVAPFTHSFFPTGSSPPSPRLADRFAGRLLLVRGLPVDPLAPLLPLRSCWRLAPGNLEQPAHRALKVC